MYSPEVSIIIPVYNGSDYLDYSIRSALKQSYEKIEVIVVNDGSNDNFMTRNVALKYKNKIKYYEKDNGGVSSALNFGISKSNGEWISWLSHDDLYDSKKIEKQIVFLNNLLEEGYDKNKLIIFCYSENINSNSKRIYTPSQKQNLNTDKLHLILRNIKKNRFNGCTFLLPKECFNQVGFFIEDLKFIQDTEFWYRLLFKNYNFKCLPEVLVQYRYHTDQTSNKLFDVGIKEAEWFYKKIIDYLFDNSDYTSPDTFYKLSRYIGRKGFTEISKYAFLKGKSVENNKIKYIYKQVICRIDIWFFKYYRRIKMNIFNFFYKIKK